MLVFLVSWVNPTRPVFAQFILVNIGHTNDGGSAIGLAISGNYAFLAKGGDGLSVYDISNPANPINIGHTNNGGSALSLAVSGNYAYLANNEDGLRVYDVSYPANPINIGHIYNGGRAKSVAISGNYAFVANEFDGLRVYDVSTPSNPINVGHTNNNNYPNEAAQAVAIAGSFAYVASIAGGLRVYDVSNPAVTSYVGNTNDGGIGGFAIGVAASANYAYVAYLYGDDSGGLRIYDVTNPTQPLHVGYTNTGAAYGVALSGSYAFISDYFHGLCVEDISVPTNPFVIACANNPDVGAPGVAVSGNYVYLAHSADGLRIYLFAPQLNVALNSSNVAFLSWPVPLAPGFVLQQNSDLNTTNWLTLTNIPVVVSNRNQVTVSPTGGQIFYRLKAQ